MPCCDKEIFDNYRQISQIKIVKLLMGLSCYNLKLNTVSKNDERSDLSNEGDNGKGKT